MTTPTERRWAPYHPFAAQCLWGSNARADHLYYRLFVSGQPGKEFCRRDIAIRPTSSGDELVGTGDGVGLDEWSGEPNALIYPASEFDPE